MRADAEKVAVETSIKNAKKFLKDVLPELGPPKVTGGTLHKPKEILTLYWVVSGADKIAGVFVTFNGDNTTNIRVDKPRGSAHVLRNIPVKNLRNLHILEQFRELRDAVKEGVI